MAVKLSPIFMDAQLINAIPANGAKLFTYAAGSTTKQTTYTDSTGLVANPNPIILNSRGEPPNPIWLTSGQTYKFVFTNSTDTDPPTSPIRTIDNISGVNDTSLQIDQWVSSSSVPTYISASSFTVTGDKTSDFQVGRRIKLNVTAGTVFGYVSSSSYGALTTVGVSLDSGALDSGLSSVSLGLLTPTNPSTPLLTDNYPIVSGSLDRTKKLRNEIDGFTTGTTRTATWQNKDITVAGLDDVAAALPAGTRISFTGTSAPAGYLVCPTSQTNISRTTYAALFAAIGTTWGAGDGATTFGMPYFPADYTSVQANANVGTTTAGQVIAHTHTVGAYPGGGTYSNTTGPGPTTTGQSGSTGGAANYAAGVRELFCVKY